MCDTPKRRVSGRINATIDGMKQKHNFIKVVLSIKFLALTLECQSFPDSFMASSLFDPKLYIPTNGDSFNLSLESMW